MTTSAWLLQIQGSLDKWVAWLKEFQNTIIIHQPFTIPLSFKELAQTLVSKRTYISSKAIIQFRALDNSQQLDAYELASTDKWLDGLWRGLIDDNCVLDFFNYLFNIEPWNCSNLHSW